MYKLAYLLTVISGVATGWYIYVLNMGQETSFLKLAALLPFNEKFLHALIFGFLAFSVNFALKFKTIRLDQHNIYIGSLIIGGLAILEELTHGMLATRNLDFFELLAVCIGITIFSYITHAFKLYLTKKQKLNHKLEFNNYHY